MVNSVSLKLSFHWSLPVAVKDTPKTAHQLKKIPAKHFVAFISKRTIFVTASH